MAKKIYDIIPPKISHQVQDQIKDFLGDNKKRKHRRNYKKERQFFQKPVFAISGVIVLVLAVYLFFKLPKANIEIWPKVDVLSFQQTIVADKSAILVDLSKAVLPAQYFEETKQGSEDFPATGNASNEGKAAGTITVYNKYDPPAPLTLKAGTHFLSDSGKYFVTLQKITIPAAKKTGSKITPGSGQVKVEAAEGGESYNIKPAKFSVPKLSGTPYYYSTYAESTSTMTGGFAGKVKKVTDDDIAGAKDVLTKKLLSDAESSIKSKISSDYILLDNAISSETVSASTNTKSGTVVDSFTYEANVRASALVFKKSDLEKFAKDYIISKIPDKKTMLDKTFNLSYSAKSVDIKGGKATLDLDFSAGIYQNIDTNSLIPLLTRKNSSQINETISNSLGDQVSNIKVSFWPFWVTKAPKSQKTVKIDLKFE